MFYPPPLLLLQVRFSPSFHFIPILNIHNPDTYSDSTLHTHGLIINTTHHTLICTECGCTIDHNKVRAHFTCEHKAVKLPRDFDTIFAAHLAQHYPHLVYPPLPPKDPVPAVYGLRLPLPLYRICRNCRRGFKGRDPSNPTAPPSKAFDKHVCVSSQPNPHNRTYIESHVQSFKSSVRSPYFAVLLPSTAPQLPNPWASYSSMIKTRPSPTQTLSTPENYRIIDQFLHKEGWLSHVDGLDPVKLRTLIALNPDFPNLVKHCEAFLRHHQDSLTSYYARRLISTRPR